MVPPAQAVAYSPAVACWASGSPVAELQWVVRRAGNQGARQPSRACLRDTGPHEMLRLAALAQGYVVSLR